MKLFFAAIITITTISFFSCDKEEGPGGTSTIIGNVWVKDYSSDFTLLKAEFWAEEEDVYIIYGNDTIYSDRTRTNYDGSYWFQYLHEGSYTIYAYSRDSSAVPSPSGRVPIKIQVTIDDSGKDYVVPKITILK